MTGIVSIVFGVLLCAASVFTFRRRAEPQTGRNMRAGAASGEPSLSHQPFGPGRAGATAIVALGIGVLAIVYGAATL
jgi:hypothetical protein